MGNSLRIYRTIMEIIRQLLDDIRVTRQRNLGWMVTGLVMAEHVHLAEIAAHKPGTAKLGSVVKTFRRFLSNDAVDVHGWYAPIARKILQAAAGGRIRLLIDTLELSGRRQVLMLALAYRSRAMPIFWHVTRRKGVSDSEAQIALLEEIVPWIPTDAEVVLMGDGEFHSTHLMGWLQQHGWHFRLRLHADTHLQLSSGTWVQCRDLNLEPGERRYFQQVMVTQSRCYGPIHLAAVWPEDEEDRWYIATDQPASYATLRDYSLRMWIEEFFGDIQGSRFSLHLTRIYVPERLSRLLLIVCLAYTWLLHTGAWVIKRGFRHLIDRSDRRDRSLFQLGVHWLQRCLTNSKSLHIGFKPYL
jgi:hypothetical protein